MNERVKELLARLNENSSEDINFAPMVGKVCYGVKRNGKTFMSRLVAIDDERKLLWFELKSGLLVNNPISEIVMLQEVDQ